MYSFSRLAVHVQTISALVGITALVLVAGCRVQPLYQSNGGGSTNVLPSIRTQLAQIAIDAPNDRFSQMVRNRLIFLLYGGASNPSTTSYRLSLNTSFYIRSAVQVDIGDTTDRTGRASTGTVVAQSNYVLTDKNGKPLVTRVRTISSSFDRPRQEYANLQAEENAKKLAADELAEQLLLSLAQELAKR